MSEHARPPRRWISALCVLATVVLLVACWVLAPRPSGDPAPLLPAREILCRGSSHSAWKEPGAALRSAVTESPPGT